MKPKTNAQRQAEYKARRQAEGLVLVKAWTHADDAAALREYAAKLARARERARRKAGQA